MGEIAEAMLDGQMCQGCGEWLDDALGYPGYCAGCAGDFFVDTRPPGQRPQKKDTPCPICEKRLRGKIGLRHHMRDKHGIDHVKGFVG